MCWDRLIEFEAPEQMKTQRPKAASGAPEPPQQPEPITPEVPEPVAASFDSTQDAVLSDVERAAS